MKRLIAGLIGSVCFAGLLLGTAAASDDEHYEYGEHYEHGRYYNPYYNNNVRLNGNRYYNNGYRNHERYEYDNDDYRYRGTVRNGYYNGSYRNHEAYEYGGYHR